MKHFKLFFTMLLLCAAVTVGGCGDVHMGLDNLLSPFSADGEQPTAAAAQTVGETASDVVDVVETAIGSDVISPETAETLAAMNDKLGELAALAKVGAKVGAQIAPESAKPYLTTLESLLAALVALSGTAGGLLYGQKKKAENVTKIVVAGANELPGAGAAIRTTALTLGQAAAVENAYRAAAADGLLNPTQSGASVPN